MKNILLSVTFLFSAWSMPSQAQTHDTIVMGNLYANDVFYSLENGTIKTETRNNWDLGFYTNRWSAGIILNDGTGTMLYTYPKSDTSGWNSVDTSGMAQWVNTYNSDTIWEDGAFNRHALGHPDYGWGVYNMVSHDVIGDSLYVLRLSNGNLKKIWIQRKNSVANTFYFKYADIDNQNEVSFVLDATPYESKLFVYYSITTGQIIDREPAKTDWDLLFSKYAGTTYDNDGNPSPYLVVGALCNVADTIGKAYPVSSDFEDWSNTPLNGEKCTIGHDWKSFDMNTFSWLIADSTAYFIKNQQGNIYKLSFDYFSGSGSGKAGFVKKLISLSSVNDNLATNQLTVYPNPAQTLIHLETKGYLGENQHFMLFDQMGRLVFQKNLFGDTQLLLPELSNGMYFIKVSDGNKVIQQKLLIQK